MSIDLTNLPRRAHAGAAILLFATAACVEAPPPTASVAIPPIPAGEARVWFYRPIDAYDSMATPYIRMNEAIVAVSMPEGASYRDVPPGPYHITVDSYGKDFNQDKNVQLAAGQELYCKVVSLRAWVDTTSGGGGDGSSTAGDSGRNTFYVWLIPAETARGDVARAAFYGS
ncbi:MAG: hypothetical protein JO282_10040 [Alphaproteobacteria bacterium]|nr:hypothetical protein [Alphaproteobacteria bacterium]